MARFITILCVLVFGMALFFINAGKLLSSPSEVPAPADIILVLGSPERIKKAESLYEERYSHHIFLTIPELLQSFPQSSISSGNITVPSWRPKTTYQEALAFKEYLQDHPLRSAIIVTDPYHLYRVSWTFEHVFKKYAVKFTYVSTRPQSALGFWWKDINDRIFVLTEIPKVLYYWVYHGLFGIETDPQWTVDAKNWYAHKLQELMASRWLKEFQRLKTLAA